MMAVAVAFSMAWQSRAVEDGDVAGGPAGLLAAFRSAVYGSLTARVICPELSGQRICG